MSQAASFTGTTIDGKYAIDALIGEGGMGAVYRARHLGTKRVVALKVIVPRMTGSREFVERFRREAESAGGLRHPNVVDVTDFGFARAGTDEVAYLVMEYLDGCTLAEILDEEGSLPLTWVVDIVDQVCSAVDEAHQRGIIHRDLKPQNIWLEPNRRGGYTVKVLDFGLAKIHEQGPVPMGRFVTGSLPKLSDELLESLASGATPPLGPAESGGPERAETGGLETPRAQEQLTQVGTVLGTPFYMSPEQCRAMSTVDARSDVYAIGVLAYEMLAGRRPFSGGAMDVMVKHLTEAPEHLGVVAPDVPKGVAEAVMSALEKDPDKRPQRATLFASTLQARAEGPGALLRRALTICSANFTVFIRLFALAYAPLFAIRMVKLGFSLAAVGRIPGRIVFAWDLIVGVVLTGVVAFFATAVSRGVASLVLAQLVAAPLQTVKIRVAARVVWRRLRPLLVGACVFVGIVMTPLAVFIASMNAFAGEWAHLNAGLYDPRGAVIGLVELLVAIASLFVAFSNLVSYSLYPIALLVEDIGVREALSRSKHIVARGRASVTVVTSLELLELVIPFVFSFALVAFVQDKIVNLVAVVAVATASELLFSPMASVAYAMLYLKLRQAGGESLAEMLREQLGQQEIPKSRWMQRMRMASGANTRSPGDGAAASRPTSR